MKTFYIHTQGCQMNEYDSERLAQAFFSAGWTRAANAEDADLLLLNTCTVRQLAEDKAFSQIGRWAKLKIRRPGLVIGMVGCLAQHLGEAAFRRAPAIDFLAGPRSLLRVPELAAASPRRRLTDFSDRGFGEGAADPQNPLTASLAVMEGCDQCCAYCAVPRARGRETSRPVAEILAEARRRLSAGAKEIILLGQNVNHYGRKLPGSPDFSSLLGRICELPGLLRLRFLTSHPGDFSPRIMDAMGALPQVCESLHLPLQSGSDRILADMRRGYTVADFRCLLADLRRAVPGIQLTTDLIVGFPGESEEDFQATLALVQEAEFDSAYCFKYSPRRGTKAASLPGQLPQAVKEERLSRLLSAVKETATRAYASALGTEEEVLVEARAPAPGQVKGRTRGNRWVTFPGPATWLGREVRVRIVAADVWALKGIPVAPATPTPP